MILDVGNRFLTPQIGTMAIATEKKHWRLLALVTDGKPTQVASGSVLTVDGEHYSFAVNGTVYQKGITKFDGSKSPRESEVTITQGKGKGNTLLQISKFEDDLLIACLAKAGAPRPTAFQSTPGSGTTLSVWMKLSPTEAARPTPNPWAQALFIAMVFILTGILTSLKSDLAPLLGSIGAIAVCGLLCVAVVMAVSFFCQWGWRDGLVHGVSLAVGLLTYIDLRKLLEPTLPEIGAVAVAGSSAVMAGLIVSSLLGRILKPRVA